MMQLRYWEVFAPTPARPPQFFDAVPALAGGEDQSLEGILADGPREFTANGSRHRAPVFCCHSFDTFVRLTGRREADYVAERGLGFGPYRRLWDGGTRGYALPPMVYVHCSVHVTVPNGQ